MRDYMAVVHVLLAAAGATAARHEQEQGQAGQEAAAQGPAA